MTRTVDFRFSWYTRISEVNQTSIFYSRFNTILLWSNSIKSYYNRIFRINIRTLACIFETWTLYLCIMWNWKHRISTINKHSFNIIYNTNNKFNNVVWII